MSVHTALVIGGSGFVGSAICKACLARGWSVVSVSRSGPSQQSSSNAFATGHHHGAAADNAWKKRVEWIKGDAFDEKTLKGIMPNVTSVIHTLGILLESDYKSGGLAGLLSGLADGLRENYRSSRQSANPLATTNHSIAGSTSKADGKYERINRDSALAVLQAYLETRPAAASSMGEALRVHQDNRTVSEFPFVYLSAEDTFRPMVPERYILTKRQAESRIQRMSETARSMMSESSAGDNEFERLERPGRLVRPVYIRPSFIYDSKTRPPSAIPAALLRGSSAIQGILPPSLRARRAADILATLVPRGIKGRQGGDELPNSGHSLANLLSIPPIHVDTVAEAVCRSVEDASVRGVVGVEAMQALVEGRRRYPQPTPRSATGSSPV